MTAVIDLVSDWALTALSMTRMTSLTSIFLVDFVSNLGFTFSPNRNREDHIQCVGHLST